MFPEQTPALGIEKEKMLFHIFVQLTVTGRLQHLNFSSPVLMSHFSPCFATSQKQNINVDNEEPVEMRSQVGDRKMGLEVACNRVSDH